MNIYIIIVPSKEVIETKEKQKNNIVKKSKNVVLTHFDKEKMLCVHFGCEFNCFYRTY